MCKAPFDVGTRLDRCYCDICRKIRARQKDKERNPPVEPTVKICPACGGELTTSNGMKKYHTDCKRKMNSQRTMEYLRNKYG